jgi:3-(3-hydroxy-phenyl)propionate hydroxylase
MRPDCDVLVVGLGPVGDVLAGLCALEGLRVIAIERDTEPYPLPRAAVFDDEIMRIFQRMGVAERLEQICVTPERYEFIAANGDILLDFPVKGMPTISGWEGSYVLHQPAVEVALRSRLGELAVDMRLGHRFIGLEQGPGFATVSIAEGERSYQVNAKFVVGCDGGASPVRKAIGGELRDYEFDEPWLVIDAIAPDSAGLPTRLIQLCDPARPTTYLKMTGERYRWEFMMLPGETEAQVMDDDFIRQRLEGWGDIDQVRIDRKAVYRFHGLIAEQWRKDRVLLAGDSAHQMPPFAGQGMCSGIRDAGNLAWKLGAVVRGEADVALLDTYQAERAPHVEAIIETAIAMGRIVCLRDPGAAAERDRQMLAQRAAGQQQVSMSYPDLFGGCLDNSAGAGALFPQPGQGAARMDEVLGKGFWLLGDGFAEIEEQSPVVSVFDLSANSYSLYAPVVRAWLAERGAAAVLVRPDRHVFGTGDPRELLRRIEGFMTLPRSPAI